MRTYLVYRMKTEGVSKADIQSLLNVSEKTVRNKLSGKTDFTWEEARKIRNKFFQNDDFNVLFENVEPLKNGA